MLSRKRQIAAKVEDPEGEAVSLAAADAKSLVINPKVAFEPEPDEREIASIGGSRIGRIFGKLPGTLSFSLELRGSGAATTEPDWFKYIKACGFTAATYYSINIGTITTGPFQHGETIVGTSSNAHGRVVIKTATGVSAILFVPTSTATFQSGEVITGGTSGATATTASTPTATGKELKPITDSISSLTMASYEDGLKKLLKGCRGSKIKFSFKTGKRALMDYEFKGAGVSVTDSSLLTVTGRETTIPPAFLSAALSIDNVAAKLSEMEIDLENTIVSRDDVSETKGILSFLISVPRKLTGSFNPEMLSIASHDFHSKWFGNTEMILDFVVGSSAGNRFRFYGPKVQYNKIEDDSRDGMATAKCTFDFNGDIDLDNELTILHY
jgi:hypothetical protein